VNTSSRLCSVPGRDTLMDRITIASTHLALYAVVHKNFNNYCQKLRVYLLELPQCAKVLNHNEAFSTHL